MDILTLARVITTLAKIIAASWLFVIYLKIRRTSAVILGVGLLVYAMHTLSDILGSDILSNISTALTATLLLLTSTTLLIEEEGEMPSLYVFWLLSLTPIILAGYTLALAHYMNSGGLVVKSIVHGVSGFFMAFSGIMIIKLKEVFGRKSLFLISSLVLLGLHQMDYPFLRPIKWFAPIGFTIATILTLTLLYGVIEVFRSEMYFRLTPHKASELKSGSLLVTVEEFKKNIYQKLENFPALAFVRNIQTPEAWYKYFVTRAISDYESDISPTDLPRMLELSKRYLQASEGGVVIVDCPEYLALYNGFDALLKFLATLRDMVIVHRGTLVVVTEREVWDDRQWVLLTRILREESS
ncbi:hypothetical protein A3L04_10810 [Thermococcus chitonophagus]|uniref:DUF835 domain-containing protein n=1 Tax=Thermococcus chitonophagus TaxID=54262 RepID=A0A161KAK0_9EURY|nr:DUF835 domain-containing protein [Thermococcus chitonophagus]ASJ17522.1 hypothetical protein A3L04_10810 [Thermococcus chitonophagus]CUX78178.1 hypothetical protein CHITON_1399 [Thermococcus chitonophagus]